ncbi:GNAT family N-acetyltransferase [Tenacibaculum agarivorans]|uniref:GNAT family N-acetyltransferase n=1 Tax=Tenacibaculum agarivorans TaxID=1908389 RepID=UPI00094B8393|nr:GNAT family N-acetyltransferase [Tenacibaculum agarivorans]
MLKVKDISIRNFKEKDIAQLIELCKAHAIHERTEIKDEKKLALVSNCFLDSTHNIHCWVVEQSNILVGYATFCKQFSTWGAAFYMYLDCLYLKEEVRGKGLGKKIMSAIKVFALAENCEILQWQTPDFNTNAIAFYEKLGAKKLSKKRFMWNLT